MLKRQTQQVIAVTMSYTFTIQTLVTAALTGSLPGEAKEKFL